MYKEPEAPVPAEVEAAAMRLKLTRSGAQLEEAGKIIDGQLVQNERLIVEAEHLWLKVEGYHRDNIKFAVANDVQARKIESLNSRNQVLVQSIQGLKQTNDTLKAMSRTAAAEAVNVEKATPQEHVPTEEVVPTEEQIEQWHLAADYVYETLLNTVNSIYIHLEAFDTGDYLGEGILLSGIQHVITPRTKPESWNRSAILGLLHSRISDRQKAQIVLMVQGTTESYTKEELDSAFFKNYFEPTKNSSAQKKNIEWGVTKDVGGMPMLELYTTARIQLSKRPRLSQAMLLPHLALGTKKAKPLTKNAEKTFDEIAQSFYDLMFI